MNRILVFTATYNEADNIRSLISEIFGNLPQCEVLVVDDRSPDGTGRILDEIRARDPRLHVQHRPAKNGLGTAHKLAVKFAIAQRYDALITMDADFSHNPAYLPEMVRLLGDHEFVIGSRYAPGGSCEYPPSRVLLSRVANGLTRFLLAVPLHETTTSYRGFRRSLLNRLNVDAIHANGYGFFVECIYQVRRLTRSMTEFPIRFEDRRAGSTKISKKEIWLALTTLLRLTLQRAGRVVGIQPRPLGLDDHDILQPCSRCGCAYHVQERSPQSQAGANGRRIVKCLGCGQELSSPRLGQTAPVG